MTADFLKGLKPSSPEENTAEFVDAADVFLSYKEKLADFEDEHGTGGPISEEEADKLLYGPKKDKKDKTAAPITAISRLAAKKAITSPATSTSATKILTSHKDKKPDDSDVLSLEERSKILKKDFAQPKKENPSTGTKGKYPIPDRQHAKSALGFAKMHGDPKAYAAVRKKVEQKYPDMIEKDASLFTNMVRSAAGWGTAGGVTGALTANKGERLKGFGKGLAIGTVGGLAAAPAEHAATKLVGKWFPKTSADRLAEVAMQDPPELPPELRTKMRASARYRYPSHEPVAKEVKGVWGLLKKKYRDYLARRSAMGVAPVIPPQISSALKKEASLADMIPSHMKTPAGAGIIAATAAAFGIGNYIANMPRKGLDGKGKAQVHYEGKVRANQAAGEEGAGLSKKLRNRMAEFQKNLATEFTKHPGGAAATGAAVGAGIGSQAAKIIQGIR